MESTSEPMKIHISQTTYELLGPDYLAADRGEIVVKGKGIYIFPSPKSPDPFCIDLHVATYTASVPCNIFGCLVATRHGLSRAIESYCPLSTGNVANKDLFCCQGNTPKRGKEE